MTIDPALWIEKLRPLEVKQQQEWDENWTWTTGGCFAFAEHFQKAFGGEFYGVCRPEQVEVTEFSVDHALVMLDGVLYDHDGPYDLAKIQPNQVLKHRSEDYVFWFEDDFFDDHGWATIGGVLADCANEWNASHQSSGPRI